MVQGPGGTLRLCSAVLGPRAVLYGRLGGWLPVAVAETALEAVVPGLLTLIYGYSYYIYHALGGRSMLVEGPFGVILKNRFLLNSKVCNDEQV